MAQISRPRDKKSAGRLSLEGRLAIGAVAMAVTVLIRYKVYTPDANLLIVGVTFVLVYAALWGLVATVLKIRSRRRERAERADAEVSRPDAKAPSSDVAE